MPAEKYDTTNGVLELRIGGQTRTLIFRRKQMYVLEKRLGQDPLSFIGGGGGENVFLIEAVLAGLSQDSSAKKEKITPNRVMDWLDGLAEDPEYDEDDFKVAILYAIARGKPKKEAEAMCKLLDETFGSEEAKAPFPSGSVSSIDASPSPSKLPHTG